MFEVLKEENMIGMEKRRTYEVKKRKGYVRNRRKDEYRKFKKRKGCLKY